MKIRDRIRELRRVPARQLRPNPLNWRTHPRRQREALQGLLAEIGYAGALLARELEDGSLELIDGHLRAETTPDEDVPVLVLDVDAAEARKLLACFDPLAALAGRDDAALAELTAGVETENAALREMLDRLQQPDELEGDPPPSLDVPESWQLLVECRDEADQRALFERLQSEGYACRVLTL